MKEVPVFVPGADACLGIDGEWMFDGGLRVIIFEIVDHLLYSHRIGGHLLPEVDDAAHVGVRGVVNID